MMQMTSAENLADAADRYLTEILTSAKLARDVATIVDLLLQVQQYHIDVWLSLPKQHILKLKLFHQFIYELYLLGRSFKTYLIKQLICKLKIHFSRLIEAASTAHF